MNSSRQKNNEYSIIFLWDSKTKIINKIQNSFTLLKNQFVHRKTITKSNISSEPPPKKLKDKTISKYNAFQENKIYVHNNINNENYVTKNNKCVCCVCLFDYFAE